MVFFACDEVEIPDNTDVTDDDIAVGELTLDKSNLELESGQSVQLTATVLPEDATDKTVVWSSSDETVAIVKDGLVTAVEAGEADITASAGDKKANCKVIVKNPPVEGPSYATPMEVDLGLSVKWASFNLGATKPEEFGYLFSWGETEPKESDFYISNYKFYVDGKYTKYGSNASVGVVDNLTQLDPEDDAATVNLGNGWRMPTQAECNELKECDWSEAEQNGVQGYLLTAPNGNTVFFPYNFSVFEDVVYEVTTSFSCWTSTRKSNSTGLAYILDIHHDYSSTTYPIRVSGNTNTNRYSGLNIRPVKD